MSELQSDDTITFDDSEVQDSAIEESQVIEEVENPEVGSDLATEEAETTATASESEQTSDSKVNQDAINKAINKKHFEMMEERRRADALNAQLEEYRRKEQQAQQQSIGRIPDAPDPYDDDYEEKLAARDEAIKRATEYAYQQQIAQQQQQELVRQQQQKQVEQITVALTDYEKRAQEAGITRQELQEAGNFVAQAMSLDMQLAIVKDPDGALITKYLAANPQEIEQLTSLDPWSAAIHIERNLRAKAAGLKPKTSSAPAPARNIKGGGADPDASRYKLTTGATLI